MNSIYASTKELIPLFRELLSNGNTISVRITGNSMFPLFSHMRDTLSIAGCAKYKKRDIVMYVRDSGDLVIHRVVGKKNGLYTMCGDNQTVAEFPIREEQLMGKVISFERKGKKYKAGNLLYKIYSFIWCISLKLRKPVLVSLMKIKIKFKNGRKSA